MAGELPDDRFQFFFAQRHFAQNVRSQSGREGPEIFFSRCDEQPAHIQGSGADEQLMLAGLSVASRSVFLAWENQDDDFVFASGVPGLPPAKDIHTRFAFPVAERKGIVEFFKKQAGMFRRPGADDKYRTYITFEDVEPAVGVLHHDFLDALFFVRLQGIEFFHPHFVAFPVPFDGQHTPFPCLEVHVVGGRSTAYGAVVEKDGFRYVPGHVAQGLEVRQDALWCMPPCRDGKVFR